MTKRKIRHSIIRSLKWAALTVISILMVRALLGMLTELYPSSHKSYTVDNELEIYIDHPTTIFRGWEGSISVSVENIGPKPKKVGLYIASANGYVIFTNNITDTNNALICNSLASGEVKNCEMAFVVSRNTGVSTTLPVYMQVEYAEVTSTVTNTVKPITDTINAFQFTVSKYSGVYEPTQWLFQNLASGLTGVFTAIGGIITGLGAVGATIKVLSDLRKPKEEDNKASKKGTKKG